MIMTGISHLDYVPKCEKYIIIQNKFLQITNKYSKMVYLCEIDMDEFIIATRLSYNPTPDSKEKMEKKFIEALTMYIKTFIIGGNKNDKGN